MICIDRLYYRILEFNRLTGNSNGILAVDQFLILVVERCEYTIDLF